MTANPDHIDSSIQVGNLDSAEKDQESAFFYNKLDSELVDKLRPDTYVNYEQVRDSAHRQQPTTLVTVRDPIDNRVIAKIRNPKIGIKPYPDPELARLDLD